MPGDLVNTGSKAFRLDDLSHLLVDVQVPEVDINRIKVGQDVSLSFDAISNRAYEGKVSDVARVGTVDSGLVNFKVTIEILNPDDQVLPGMTAGVSIIVSQLEDVLTVPNRAIRLVENRSVVYILKNNAPTEVNIEIGASSDTMSEIISSDLKEGDKIILNPPSSFLDLDFGGGPPF
jgi:HlyD family secretion protein